MVRGMEWTRRKNLILTVQFIAHDLITATAGVCAKSEVKALTEAKPRIKRGLKQESYQFRSEDLRATDVILFAA
jgi:hypothetical protein